MRRRGALVRVVVGGLRRVVLGARCSRSHPPLRVGDFVAGYSEILHSAHANTSEHKRTCLTMWYYPAFTELPGRTQASIAHFTRALNFETPERAAASS